MRARDAKLKEQAEERADDEAVSRAGAGREAAADMVPLTSIAPAAKPAVTPVVVHVAANVVANVEKQEEVGSFGD